MTATQLLVAMVAGGVALATPLALRPLLVALRSFDVPNGRSSHARPTLRGAGIAPLAGLIAGVVIAGALEPSLRATPLTVIAVGAVAAAALGLFEDLRGARVVTRLGVQLVLGATVAVGMSFLYDATLWWTIPIAIAMAWYINVANFMDGINGISSGHGLVAGLSMATMGALGGVEWLCVLGIIIAVVFIAFLPWNVFGAGMFLGDVGSYLLGSTVGMTAAGALFSGFPFVTVVAPLALYLADTGSTLAVRVLKRESWREPHRTHVYQRLTDVGLSHLQVAGIVTIGAGCCGLIGLTVVSAGATAQLVAGAAVVAIAAAYLMSPRLLGRLVMGREHG